MGISSYVMYILMAGAVLVCFGLIVNDFEKGYIDTGISNATKMNSSLLTNYNSTEEIRSNFQDVESGLNDLGNSTSWWQGLGAFVGAVPLVAISFPKAVILTLYSSIGIISTVATELGIPPTLSLIASTALIIFIIFQLINFVNAKNPI